MRGAWRFVLIGVAMTGSMGAAGGEPAAEIKAAASGEDPYVWLETLDSPKVMDWVRAQNARTLAVLEKDPHFEALHRDALAVAQAPDRIPEPRIAGGAVLNFWQDARHVRGIWRTTSIEDYAAADPKWKTLLDLDELARTEGANWVWKGADCEESVGRRCMVRLSEGGEDATAAREFDLVEGRFVEGGLRVPRAKSWLAWEDRDTLLVATEWSPGEVTKSGYPYIVKRLARGGSPASAVEVFRAPHPQDVVWVIPVSFRDGAGHAFSLLQLARSFFETEFYLVSDQGPVRLGLPLKAEVAGLVDGQIIVRLAQDWLAGGKSFAQGSVVAVDLEAARKAPASLQPVLVHAPGPRESILAMTVTQGELVMTTLENVRGRAAVLRRGSDGAWSRRVLSLPENSAVSLLDADLHGSTVYFQVEGFLDPVGLWRADARTGVAQRIRAQAPQFDATRHVVEQLEARSSDGTMIPYFVVRPAAMARDGHNPTILSAYGGFEISETPNYEPTRGKLWLERGGTFVLANIRGGGEFGPAWHEAGLKTKRQIIYDDFASVARDLAARGIADRAHLGIVGGSNGGLLMGVEMTQHPELFRAVQIAVPLLDMLRFETIQAGASWVGEYGSVEVPAERDFLASISPYANLRRGVDYPEPFIWTTTRDDRVGPQHARKFAARLSEWGVPYYFYEVIEGGHGAGANLQESARTRALGYTYFARRLQAAP